MSDTVTEPKNALERYIAWTARQLLIVTFCRLEAPAW